MRILLVDDDRHVLTAMRRLLEQRGHSVDAHEDAATALEAFARDARAFHGALLDVNVGDGDGVALSAELRAIRADVPIAFSTGSDASAARAQRHGVVLRKPCSPRDIEAVLATWADR